MNHELKDNYFYARTKNPKHRADRSDWKHQNNHNELYETKSLTQAKLIIIVNKMHELSFVQAKLRAFQTNLDVQK